MASLISLTNTALTRAALNIPLGLTHWSGCHSFSSPWSIITVVNPETPNKLGYPCQFYCEIPQYLWYWDNNMQIPNKISIVAHKYCMISCKGCRLHFFSQVLRKHHWDNNFYHGVAECLNLRKFCSKFFTEISEHFCAYFRFH